MDGESLREKMRYERPDLLVIQCPVKVKVKAALLL